MASAAAGKADDRQAAFPQRRGNGSNGVFNHKPRVTGACPRLPFSGTGQ